MPFDRFADQLVRTDEDIYLTRLEVIERLFDFFGTLEPAEVLDTHGQILHSLGERVIVLQREYGVRYENGYLFAVGRHLKGSTHSHFGLAESHIAADESVHRHRTLEVALHICRRFRLVRRVFIEE